MTKNEKMIADLRKATEAEMQEKNSLYNFILEHHLYNELYQFESTHDITSFYCRELDPVDELAEAKKEFEAERNIKNNLRTFILRHGKHNELKEYYINHGINPEDHAMAVAAIYRVAFDKLKRNY